MSFRVLAPRSVEKLGALNRKYTTETESKEARRASRRRSAADRAADPVAAKRNEWRKNYPKRADVAEKIRLQSRVRMRRLRAEKRRARGHEGQ